MNPARSLEASPRHDRVDVGSNTVHGNLQGGLRGTRQWSVWAELAKPRLTGLVLVTTGAGYLLADPLLLRAAGLAPTIVGTALVAAAASALNMVWEQRWDRLMTRTRNRPLPSERVTAGSGFGYAAVTLVSGAAILSWGANRLAVTLALLSLVIYVFVYTPLKRRWTLNTLVGAVPGAIPPLIGWGAARGSLDGGAWALFAIVFIWQIPHFLAISWLYREDYVRSGFRMLSVVDPSGETTTRLVLVYLVALLPISLAPTFLGLTNVFYALIALPLGLAFLAVGIRFRRQRTHGTARQLFRASLLYLAALLTLMVFTVGMP